MYGIPEFRLPKTIVQQEIQSLKDAGVDIQPDMVIGKILSIDELMAGGYDAVFIGFRCRSAPVHEHSGRRSGGRMLRK